MERTSKKLLIILEKLKEILVQFKMKKNLKKRIFTSLSLLVLLFVMLIDNFILGYFIIIVGILSILEFFNIIKIILKKDNIKQFFFSSLFVIYVFLFLGLFLYFSLFLNLRIIIFTVLLTCVASDLGGYIFGKIFRGPKLTQISPNKTISGSIGSLLLSIIFISTVFYYLTKSFNPNIIVIGILISFFCQLGDLFFSFLKRKSSLKDTGNILPGHGGILDRIDGMLLAIPFGFLLILTIY